MSEIIDNAKIEREIKLLSLQKEYLSNTLKSLDEIIALSDSLENISDETLIREYLKNIDELESQSDEYYRIACDIEKNIRK